MRWQSAKNWWQGSKWPPRKWQAEALPAVVNSTTGAPVCVQAVMGAGKSILLAELAAMAELEDDEVVVVTTSSRALVVQLAQDLIERINAWEVGQYYSDSKQADRRYVVCCLPSAPKLAGVLAAMGRRCALWIADEAHRTECAGMLEAHQVLAPQRSVGFTATPFRARKTEELSLFSDLVYKYGAVEALRDGVVCRWQVEPWTGDDVDVDDACVEMCGRGVDEHGPGVVNARNIADAEAFRDRLGEAGYAVDVVHSRRGAIANERSIRQLERGELEILVHVSMLQEGVNLPWLRWLCLRRPVGSRVRFAQEVGRVLRTHPGKERAIIYDPLDLFAEHSLTEEAVLAGMGEAPGEAPAAWSARSDAAAQSVINLGVEEDTPARVLDVITAYLRRATLDLEAEGHIERKVASRKWRKLPATSSQARFARQMMERCRPHVDRMPLEHRAAMREACRTAHAMDRGQASDLIDVLKAIAEHRGWPGYAPELREAA